ncbi:MAG: 3-coathanger stack domain-containing protein, partial [Bacteroidota bacterium]
PTANLLRAAYLYSILFQEGQQDFNSKLGKQMIINHFSQTGTPDNPSHGYHPDRQGLIDNFETTNHIHTKVNGYSVLTRNVAVSKGASDGTPRPYLEGESLFEFDKSRNIANQIFGYRHRGTVRALDGDTRVFARQRARRLLLAPVWINIVNERYQVDATAEPIENSNSSTIDNASTVRLAMKASFGILDDGVIVTEVKDPDAFVPVYSALDIRNRTPNDPYYDAKANNLLFTEPNEPNEYFGYPHLKYQNPLSVTPFEAVLVIPQNGEHSQGNDSQIPQIKDFFLSEIQPVELKLQNRRIGELIINYDADFEASKKIIAGKDITFQTPIGNFVIENNSNVRMQAGESITFEPGFSVEIGSTLSADIQSLDPSLCPNALGESDNVVLENRNNTPKSDYTTSLQANKAYDQT